MGGFRQFLAGMFGRIRTEEGAGTAAARKMSARLVIPEKAERHPGAVYQKGDFIGKNYEVLGVLGVGGFSVVYLVYSHESDTAYALKTLRDQFLRDNETRQQFRREANSGFTSSGTRISSPRVSSTSWRGDSISAWSTSHQTKTD